jgi:hypothetical protein
LGRQVAAQPVLSNKLVSTDANNAFNVLGDGKLQWGAGGANALDTNLYRLSAGILQSDNLISVQRSLVGDAAYRILLSGDTVARFIQLGSGNMEWGPGNAVRDTFLSRSGVNALTTPGALVVGGSLSSGTLLAPTKTAALTSAAEIAYNNTDGTLRYHDGFNNADVIISGSQLLQRVGVSLVETFGHSLAQGDSASGIIYSSRDNYSEKVARALGASVLNNYAVGGSISCWPSSGATGDGGYPWTLQRCRRPGSPAVAITANGSPVQPAHPMAQSDAHPQYVPRSQIVIDHAVLNDLGELGSNTPRPMQEAARTKWSRYAAAAIWEAMETSGNLTGPQWTEAGAGWTALTQISGNSGGGFRYTGTIGASKTFTVPAGAPSGRVWAFGFFLNATHDYSFTFAKNGGATTTVRLQSSVLCDAGNTGVGITNKHQNIVLRFGSGNASANSAFDFPTVTLAAGDTITFTFTVATVGGSLFAPNYAQIEADPLDGPLIVVPLSHTPINYSLWNSFPHGPSAGTNPMNDAAVTSWNTSLQSVGVEFPSRMLFVDMQTALGTKDATMVGNDSTHWNEKGHGIAAKTIIDAIVNSGMVTARLLQRPAPNPEHYYRAVGDRAQPAFQNNWGNTTLSAPQLQPLGFRRELDGRVTVRGTISKNGTGNSTDFIFQLPTGFRRAHIADSVGSYFSVTWGVMPVRQKADSPNIGVVQIPGQGSINAADFNNIMLDFYANA